MDKVSAKKLLLKDINSLITHVTDILDSEEVGIAEHQADHILDLAEELKDFVEEELTLSEPGDEDISVDDIDPEDEDEWERLIKDIRDTSPSGSYSSDSCGSSFHGDSCGGSSYGSSYGCGSSGGRGC